MIQPIFTPQLVKTLFSAGCYASPSITADLAFWIFCYPQTAELSQEQSDLVIRGRAKLAQAERFQVSVESINVQGYLFSSEKSRGTIMLVHGWTSEASHMMAFVDPLLDCGFNVVSFDLPAHGKSTGRMTNLVECARALQVVASQFSEIYGIVAHSFGGPVAALALTGLSGTNGCFNVDRIALIASPNASAYVTHSFGEAIGLNPKAQNSFDSKFENLCCCGLKDFTGSNYFARIDRPLLVLHSTDDSEIPYDHGLQYSKLPKCQFISLDHLGHRNILNSDKVRNHIARFMVS